MTSMPDSEFREFPKIARLSRLCIITEKIDGTNAQLWINEDGTQIRAGSRSRWVTSEADNYGFARWVEANQEALLTLGPGRHFGEWWGQGVQRGYGLSEKRFSLFNVERWCLHDQEPHPIPTSDPRISKMQSVLPVCVGLVPVLYKGVFTTDACEDAIQRLRESGSMASPGFNRPEGIVCFHVAANTMFKKTLAKDEQCKGGAS